MVNNGHYRMSNSNCSPPFSFAHRNTPVLGTQVGVGASKGVSERILLMPTEDICCLSVFEKTFVYRRLFHCDLERDPPMNLNEPHSENESRPAPDFRHDLFCGSHGDSGNRVETLQVFLKRSEAFCHLLIQ